MAFLRRLYRLPLELEEPVSALLWAAGSQGLHQVGDARDPAPTGLLLLEAYFEAGTPEPPFLPPAVELVQEDLLEPQDWLERYRLQARPLAIGERLLVDPRDPGYGEVAPAGEAGSRLVIHVPARQAFGTGSHESTRLALELLETMVLAGRRVLDVGAGSGILSFAALALGAHRVVGLDIDLPSALLAGQYRRLNPSSPDFFACGLGTLAPTPHFDVALLNILPERILPEVPNLAPRLAERAEVVLSGILIECKDEVLDAYEPLGFELQEQRQEGDWIAMRCRR